MTLRLIVILCLIFITPVQGLCSFAFAAASSDKTDGALRSPVLLLKKSDQHRVVHVPVGQEIDVLLVAQGGTGYQWVIDEATLDHFELIGKTSAPVDTDARGGGSVQQIWHLKSTKPGMAATKMDYFRPWEGRNKAIDHFQVQVSIEVQGGKP